MKEELGYMLRVQEPVTQRSQRQMLREMLVMVSMLAIRTPEVFPLVQEPLRVRVQVITVYLLRTRL